MDALGIAVAAIEKSYRLWKMEPPTKGYEVVLFWPDLVLGNDVKLWNAVADTDCVMVRAR